MLQLGESGEVGLVSGMIFRDEPVFGIVIAEIRVVAILLLMRRVHQKPLTDKPNLSFSPSGVGEHLRGILFLLYRLARKRRIADRKSSFFAGAFFYSR